MSWSFSINGLQYLTFTFFTFTFGNKHQQTFREIRVAIIVSRLLLYVRVFSSIYRWVCVHSLNIQACLEFSGLESWSQDVLRLYFQSLNLSLAARSLDLGLENISSNCSTGL